jgi:hypothetical protein
MPRAQPWVSASGLTNGTLSKSLHRPSVAQTRTPREEMHPKIGFCRSVLPSLESSTSYNPALSMHVSGRVSIGCPCVVTDGALVYIYILKFIQLHHGIVDMRATLRSDQTPMKRKGSRFMHPAYCALPFDALPAPSLQYIMQDKNFLSRDGRAREWGSTTGRQAATRTQIYTHGACCPHPQVAGKRTI